MITFLKANISSLIASFFDYLVTILLVTFFSVDAVLASTTGALCGGILNFMVGRKWVFQSNKRKVYHQAFRYCIVWAGNLMLTATGMYMLTKLLKVHYVLSKFLVSFPVGVLYNYNLQKRYVFKNN